MDATELQRFLSHSARQAERSEIRELLKLIARPEIISLAGGLPPPEAFPIEEVVELLPDVLRRQGPAALQYGTTEGEAELRQELVKLMAEVEGEPFARRSIDEVLITTASQQALDLCGRIFISPGDSVIVGLPAYLGALGAFRASGARLFGIPLDEQGMRTDQLRKRLEELSGEGVRPKMVYTVPDFDNPAGVTMSLERRRELLAIAREFDLLVLEDSPYRQLRYVGEALPSLAALDPEGRVVAMYTFSKILFPGLRLGWVVADPEIISKLVVAKQSADVCTSRLTQLIATEFLRAGRLLPHVERVRQLYAGKRQVFLDALDEQVDPAWGVNWTRPDGGLFLWMTLPDGLESRELFDLAIREQVAFVNGSAFYCDGSGRNTLRLNFSYPSPERLRLAAERLARCIGSMVGRGSQAKARQEM
jgi:2-aminoadipate transaminase